jgi:drug/metabolite transporter (DMT)-like permease
MMVREGLAAGALAGNAAAVGSALGFAIFTISLRWGKLDDMLPAVFVSAVLTIFVSVTMCLVLGWSLVLPAWDVGVTIFMGVFQIGLGLALYTVGSKVVPAAELTLLSMTEVLLGPFWVWAFLGETASKLTLAGGFILLSAIAGNALSGMRRRPPAIM